MGRARHPWALARTVAWGHVFTQSIGNGVRDGVVVSERLTVSSWSSAQSAVISVNQVAGSVPSLSLPPARLGTGRA